MNKRMRTLSLCVVLMAGLASCQHPSPPEPSSPDSETAAKETAFEPSERANLYPDWAPNPATAGKFTEAEIEFIRHCAENEHMEYDPQRHVLLGGGNPKKGTIRWSKEPVIEEVDV